MRNHFNQFQFLYYSLRLIDREEWTMKERRSQYESQEFDLEIYHPLEEVNCFYYLLSAIKSSDFPLDNHLARKYPRIKPFHNH